MVKLFPNFLKFIDKTDLRTLWIALSIYCRSQEAKLSLG